MPASYHTGTYGLKGVRANPAHSLLLYIIIVSLSHHTYCIVGHGRSEGDRAHIDSFKIYYDDVICHVEDTIKEYPGIPCFLMGHSNVRR